MRLLLLTVLLVPSLGTTKAAECQSNGTICINQNHMQKCAMIDGRFHLVGNGTACPDGTNCDHSSGTATCRKLDRRPRARVLSDEEPECPGPIKQPSSSCYQYYECLPVWWWWEPEIQTCPNGTAFDIANSSCLEEGTVDCQLRSTTTTTTPLPPVVVPECQGPGKHRALECHQYLECVRCLWWWKPELKTCPPGQAFDWRNESCVCAGLVNCVLPDSAVSCEGPATYPGLKCEEFYECTPFLWWWEPKLKQCPSGQAYDKGTCECADVPCVDPVPKCEGYAKYPALLINQYYECILNDLGLEWILTLKTCTGTKVFLPSVGQCV